MEADNSELYLPLKPGKKKRFRFMLASIIPGFVLISASFSGIPNTPGEVFIKYFNLLAGILIIVMYAIDYRKPGFLKWQSMDMSMVLTGLLIIAQGTTAFKPEKGFQPAHLLFLAGTFAIFKGVMLPEAKVKRGFVVNEEIVMFRKRPFSRPIKIAVQEIEKINLSENIITFLIKGKQEVKIDLKDYENAVQLHEDLNNVIFES